MQLINGFEALGHILGWDVTSKISKGDYYARKKAPYPAPHQR